jgi:hypothetical protein
MTMYQVCDHITIKWNRGRTTCKAEIRDIFPEMRCLLVHHKGGLALINYDDIVNEYGEENLDGFLKHYI